MSVTLFVPMLNNVTAPQAAAYPDLFLDLVLPEVYRDVSDTKDTWSSAGPRYLSDRSSSCNGAAAYAAAFAA